MMKNLLLVGIGGGIGSVLRYMCSRAISSPGTQVFPWGTFAVNLVGSALIGLVWGWGMRDTISSDWKLFMMTGLIGGFTTFSAFSLESLVLLQQHRYLVFLAYAIGSVLICLLAAWAGMKLSGN
jgi:CrcB protein